ncbi:hypothetical protein BMT54_00385 [Pasteurellaceae bacterium 15-036681]|nr:hypothetical protein BMT54_00385 [Pasteurellaceae bacterium 15-036681]
MQSIKLTSVIYLTTLLAACGSIGNAIISDNSLQEKAAFALNTNPDKVKISQRRGGLDDIRFTATVGKNSYQCYITTVAGVISSDAICSGSNNLSNSSKQKSSQCNALLKQAGKC